MPKSKRDKKVSLTKTTKKGLEAKQKLLESVKNCVTEFTNIFIISVENMRNNQLRELRESWTDSKFFFGKNKVMTLALGRKKEDEVGDNLHRVSKRLKGQCGIMFTNRPVEDVVSFFDEYSVKDYARTGFKATKTIELPAGPVPDFQHTLEPHLRQLGLPTTLQKGVVTLLSDHTICKKGELLTSEQARLLKLFGHKLAKFKVKVICMWSNDGKFKRLNPIEVKKKGKLEKQNIPLNRKVNKASTSKRTQESDVDEEMDLG